MPFLETCQMEQRISMLRDYGLGLWGAGERCGRYGVCRDTFHAWRARREGGAEDWFVERSHATARCGRRTPVAVCDAVVSLRRRFPHFGPRKLRAFLKSAFLKSANLEERQGAVAWPAASTIGDILKREGLVARRGGGAGRSARRAPSRRPRPPTKSGAPTSRAGSARATAAASTP